ncbi:MAG: alpha-ketoglutarate-dependent dioxygenase AlkB [Chitinophagales bacterium]|nr:alpha-ketoglutarate-dependent dioxygenase AlkB [Chitinophagales bacterium]
MQGLLFNSSSKSADQAFNLLPKDGEVLVYPDFFNKNDSDRLLEYLLHNIEWQQDQIKFYGKSVNLPRLTAWYGDHLKDYSYSRISMKTHPWTAELLEIKDRIENNAGVRFTSVLLNYYRDGNDSVSWHRDNESVLRVNPIIASVSFGATRTFKFRHISDKTLLRKVDLTHGTYVLMKGSTQHFWEHHIPKAKNILTPRVSLTFRIL